ncbi:MAG: Rieske 2Fe-2S domain-containing protein, partial [Novosphingobium sp.]
LGRMDYSAAQVVEDALVPVNVGGRLYVAQRKCPHLGFNLCKGKLEGEAVVCPLHKAKSDLKTCPVREMGNDIYVGV